MGNHHNCCSVLPYFFHPSVALGLEKDIADRQRLIDNQNFRLHVDSKSKGKTHKHTAGIRLYRLIDKVSDIGKIQNILKLILHLPA